jgi:V8-like Glu-specific endopeptidase
MVEILSVIFVVRRLPLFLRMTHTLFSMRIIDRWKLTATTLLVGACAVPMNAAAAIPETMFSSAVQIVSVNTGEKTGIQGSGILFGDYLILTNAHVIYDINDGKVYDTIHASFTLDSKKLPSCSTRLDVIAYDLEKDLAVLQMVSSPTNECETDTYILDTANPPQPVVFRPEMLLSSSIPDIGESLTLIGYPSMTEGGVTATTGMISAYGYGRDGSIAILKTDAQAGLGNSGGPAFDAKGYLVGMLMAIEVDSPTATKFAWVISLPTIDGWISDLIENKTLGLKEDIGTSGQTSCFPDVSYRQPHREAICALSIEGVLTGYDDGTFKPLRAVNRAEMLKILVRGGLGVEPNAEDERECFADVGEEWFAPYVCFAQGHGMVSGYEEDGTFRPAQTVNHAEAVKMALTVLGFPIEEEAVASSFTDVSLDDWFSPYAETAKSLGLLDESGPSFRPNDLMQRDQISELVYRALVLRKTQAEYFGQGNEYVNKSLGIHITNPPDWKRGDGNAPILASFRHPEGKAGVSIGIEKLPRTMTVEEYWSAVMDLFEEDMTAWYSVLKKEKSTFRTYPSLDITFTIDRNPTDAEEKDPALVSRIFERIFVKGKVAYILTYGAPEESYGTYRKEAMQIIESFAFEEE